MFVLFLAATVISFAIIALIKSSSVGRTLFRISLRFIAIAFILASVLTIAVDIPAYIKGSYTETGIVVLEKRGPVEMFTVEGSEHNYWRIEFDELSNVNMYIHQNPTNMEIRYNSLTNISQYPIVLSYLPMSKYITEIKVIFQEKEFTYAFYSPFDTESKVMCFIMILSLGWLGIVIVRKYLKSKNINHTEVNLC